MGERITEPFKPYEPESGYDWDEGPEPPDRPRVLWGRVIALGLILLVAFMLGRVSAPSGVSEDEFERVKAERDAAQEQVLELQSDAGSPAPAETATPADDETSSPDEGDEEETTYIVQRGDTLRSIAEDVYGDATLADLIAEANDIVDPTQLSVGDELVIPPAPEG